MRENSSGSTKYSSIFPFLSSAIFVLSLILISSSPSFEFTTSELGSQGTVLAGGRYDGLSKMLGGPDVPGVGWAAGIERLALMAQSKFDDKIDVALIGQSENINYLLMPIMKNLVQKGIKTEIIYTGNLSKKFKRANKIKASYAIILGEEEINKNVIKLKNLKLGSEEFLDLDQAIKKMRNE